MQNFKNKLYDYEATPPEGIWSKIAEQLDDEKVIELPGIRRKSRWLFYGLTAAASLAIIFLGSLFFNKPDQSGNRSGNTIVRTDEPNLLLNKDSINLNQQLLEKIINSSNDEKLLASNFFKDIGISKKYLTIAGPEGQPVKISPKVATLIISADNQYPPRPVWNEKIDEWQKIMLNNTMSATPAGLMDLMKSASDM